MSDGHRMRRTPARLRDPGAVDFEGEVGGPGRHLELQERRQADVGVVLDDAALVAHHFDLARLIFSSSSTRSANLQVRGVVTRFQMVVRLGLTGRIRNFGRK